MTFNRDVLGTPEASVASLKLLVGGKERTAQAQFTQLPLRSFVFAYAIQADDVDLDGITVPAGALVLPQGGALQDTDGVDAVLTHAAYDFPDDIVNPPLPEITEIEVSLGRCRTRGSIRAGDLANSRSNFERDVQRSR